MLEKLYCSEEGCSNEVLNVVRELCNDHYQKAFKSGSLVPVGVCSETGCSFKESFRGLCKTHRHAKYPQFFHPIGSRFGTGNFDESGVLKTCYAPSCKEKSYSKGLCSRHYNNVRNGVVSPNRDSFGDKVNCKAVAPCQNEATLQGYCRLHYERVKTNGSENVKEIYDTCPVPECGRRKFISSRICKRCNQFRWRFSLTVERVIELFQPENRVCSNQGCRSATDLHLDHDHSCCKTGFNPDKPSQVSCGECVRGWLCSPCNTSLGKLQENPRIIQGLLDFLELHQGSS